MEDQEQGYVVSVEGLTLQVRITRKAACDLCKECKLGSGQKEMVLTAVNKCGARIGDRVLIETENREFLKSVLIMYGLPLITLASGFVLGILCASWLGVEAIREPAGFFTGFGAMVLTYIWIKKNSVRWKKTLPVAAGIIKPDHSPE